MTRLSALWPSRVLIKPNFIPINRTAVTGRQKGFRASLLLLGMPKHFSNQSRGRVRHQPSGPGPGGRKPQHGHGQSSGGAGQGLGTGDQQQEKRPSVFDRLGTKRYAEITELHAEKSLFFILT